jgi:hypothetical protein
MPVQKNIVKKVEHNNAKESDNVNQSPLKLEVKKVKLIDDDDELLINNRTGKSII